MTPKARKEVSIHVLLSNSHRTHSERSDSILCQEHLGRSFERYLKHLEYAIFVKLAFSISVAAFFAKLFGLPSENNVATSLLEKKPENGKTSCLETTLVQSQEQLLY